MEIEQKKELLCNRVLQNKYLLPKCRRSKCTFSVIIMSTHVLPVSGNLHLARIFGEPSFALCIIVTITFVPGADTKSIAPPIPLTNLPCNLKKKN